MKASAMRYADIAVRLTGELDDARAGKCPNDPLLAMLWTSNNDAPNHVIAGDPAVRLT